jgi:long-chain acyl-CoA synthetase
MSNLWDLGHLKPRLDVVVPGETVSAMFWNAVGMRGNKILMRQKKLGIWHEWTWAQVAEAVREIGNGLLSLGLRPGDCASIQANTVVEWVFADIAILSAGGVCSGIYPTDAAPQVQYLCADSRTRFLFVEDDEQLDKALEVRAQLPLLQKVIVFDP